MKQKLKLSMALGSIALLLIGCGGGGGNTDTQTESVVTIPEYIVPVNGSVQKSFNLTDEPFIMTNGCVVSHLYDNTGTEVFSEDYVSAGNYIYTGHNYYDNGLTAYAVVYAKSMGNPATLTNGTYQLLAGESTIYKLTVDSTQTVVADYYSVGISIYDTDLQLVDETTCSYCQGNESFSLPQGTYYFVLENGSCKNNGNNVTISIF